MRSALAIGVLALVLGPAAAEPVREKEPSVSVQKYIQDLASRRFVERERAARALEAMGEYALGALREALKSEDAEVRDRAAEVAVRIQRQLANRKLLQAPTVCLTLKDTSLRNAIAELNKKTGLNFFLDERRVGNPTRPVTLETGEVPLWVAVDKFLRAAGLAELDYSPLDAGGSSPPGLDDGTNSTVAVRSWTAWSGRPASPQKLTSRITLADGNPAGSIFSGTAVRVRALPRDFPGNVVTNGSGEITFSLDVTPAPNLQWQGLIGVEIRRAVDEHGQQLTQAHCQTDESADNGGMLFDGMPVQMLQRGLIVRQQFGLAMTEVYDVGGGMPSNPRHVPVTLLAKERRSKVLGELEGVVNARVLTPPQTILTVEDILKASGNAMHRADATTLQVQEVKVQANGAVAIRVRLEMNSMVMNDLWQLNVRVRGRAMPFLMVNDDLSMGQGIPQFGLVDADGKSFRLAQQNHTGSSDNGQVMTHDMQFVFQPVKGQKEAARLVLTGRRSVEVEVPFMLKNVPLP